MNVLFSNDVECKRTILTNIMKRIMKLERQYGNIARSTIIAIYPQETHLHTMIMTILTLISCT